MENDDLNEMDNPQIVETAESSEVIETPESNAAVEEASEPVSQNHTLRVSSLYKQFGHKKVVRGVEFWARFLAYSVQMVPEKQQPSIW